MLELHQYVLMLLAIAAVGMYYIIRVLVRQVRLFKKPLRDGKIKSFRSSLFLISVVIIIMALIPITLNLAALFFDTGRPARVGPASIIYSLGVHIQAVLLSYLLWRIYRLAEPKD